MLGRPKSKRQKDLTGAKIEFPKDCPVYLISFDFSMNKTACIVRDLNKKHESDMEVFYFPKSITDRDYQLYLHKKVNVYKQDAYIETSKDSTGTFQESLERSTKLADLILHALSKYLKDPSNVYVANEGYSFNSRGSSALDLAAYKHVTMSALAQAGVPIDHFYTFAPVTIKKTISGFVPKNPWNKEAVIRAVGINSLWYAKRHFRLPETKEHPFFYTVHRNSPILKKKPAHLNWKDGVDDLCDAYAVMRTFLLRHVDEHFYLTAPDKDERFVRAELNRKNPRIIFE